MAVLVSFEGGEGSGKSTQARLLHATLARYGYSALLVKEPGGTPAGEHIRTFLARGTPPLAPLAELCLFQASRVELVGQVLLPALAGGQLAIVDRFADSSVAYQGYGRGLDLELIHFLNNRATQGLTPNLTILMDVPVEEGLQRLGKRRRGRFEEEEEEFHQRVREGYLLMAAAEPQRWAVVQGTGSMEQVAQRVWSRVQPLLAGLKSPTSPG